MRDTSRISQQCASGTVEGATNIAIVAATYSHYCEIFRTEAVKKSLTPVFAKPQVISEMLPKCLLKDGSIKLRLMDAMERLSSDSCLGEVSIPLKSIAPFVAKHEDSICVSPPSEGRSAPTILVSADYHAPATMTAYTLFPSKEVSEMRSYFKRIV